MRRLVALVLSILPLVMISASEAQACSCAPSGPPCQEAWKAPVIFAGTVIAVEQPTGFGARRVRFRITEAFRGNEKGEIDIHLRGGGSASCDPTFRMGEAWLVYANNQWEGGPGWTTSICSRTRQLRAAAEDLAYLRIPDEKKPGSQISGRVTRYVYDLSQGGGGHDVPIANVPVTVTGHGEKREARTDSDGRYAIPVQGGRTYQVTFGRVEGLKIRGAGQPAEISLPHYLSCATANAGALYDGRLSGQIVDGAGRPVPFLPITLVSSPRLLQQHMLTDASGHFQFAEVYPGAHDVVPSLSLWEGKRALPSLTPSPINVGPAARVDAGRLRLPAAPKMVLVEIVIETSAGQPAAGARVIFRQPEDYDLIEYAPPADKTGTFRVTVVAGQRYRVEAGSVSETGETIFEATGATPIRLRLAPPR